jgi:hypothetical protein
VPSPSIIELTELVRSRKADALWQYTACWTATARLCNVPPAKREALVKCGRWRNLHPSILAGLMLASFLPAAFAQQPTPEQISAIRASCRSDFMAQCAGVKPGGKEALECLKRNAGSVSASCKAALDAVGPRPAENAAPAPAEAKPAPAAGAPPPAPAADEPPPADAAPPPGPAAAPAAATGEGKKPSSPQVAAVRAACRSDFRVHCPGVKPGGSAALRCLQVNAAALSPHCRKAVMAVGEGGAPAAAGEPAAGPPPALAPLGPIPPMRPRRALEVLSFCGPERRMLCGNVPPGGGRILECLAENYARLSPECYGALARAAR